MYVSVRFRTYGKKWEELSAESYEALREHFPELPDKKAEAYMAVDAVASMTALQYVAANEIEVDIQPAGRAANTMLVTMTERLRRLEGQAFRESQTDAQRIVNGAMVQIAIPDLGLMTITEVQVMEDACTDKLQEELNQGWRLLAVCPPNAARRPDYVLGRSGARHE